MQKKNDDISMRKSAGMTWVAHKSDKGKKYGVRDLDKPFKNEEDAIKFADTIQGRAQEGRESISKDEETKQKQIAANKKEADERNGKRNKNSFEKGKFNIKGDKIEKVGDKWIRTFKRGKNNTIELTNEDAYQLYRQYKTKEGKAEFQAHLDKYAKQEQKRIANLKPKGRPVTRTSKSKP